VPFSATTQSIRTQRCATLAAAGLVSGADTQSQAADALAQLHAAGYLADSDLLQNPNDIQRADDNGEDGYRQQPKRRRV